ncbi:MAG: nuclear transport factor 2 family protein [Actinomycetota bacterium]|nr:nuclear transport factor 2 family protein [Actinomycetota bacterium]
MKRRTLEFLWAWFDALRRRDTESMAAALDLDVVWQGARPDLVCHGPDEVIGGFMTAYDENQEIDSLELLGDDRHIVVGVRARELAVDDLDTAGEIYNVFTIDGDKITRIDDYLRRDEALRAANIAIGSASACGPVPRRRN